MRAPDVVQFADERGSLWAVDFTALGFTPVRSFVVSAPSGAVRGGHGHRAGQQLLMRVSGEIIVDLDHEGEQASVTLTSEHPALLVSAPVWSLQTYRGEAPALVVYCDTAYDARGYVKERTPKPANYSRDEGFK